MDYAADGLTQNPNTLLTWIGTFTKMKKSNDDRTRYKCDRFSFVIAIICVCRA